MERLWAPWRLSFVEGKEGAEKGPPRGPTGCIFCDYPRAHGSVVDDAWDRDRLVVASREHAFVIMNKYPYNNGHVMVVPRRHGDALEALPAQEFEALQGLLRETVAAVRTSYRPEGMNVGMNMGRAAGAGIADHLHWHIVPRWNGDTNFMPVFADVKVISESMMDAYQRLRNALGA
jgi:ATP adenylyltransferase